MKNTMISAFKKKLSEINNYNDIIDKKSVDTYFGGWSYFDFDKFHLSQMLGYKHLMYNRTQVDLSHDEWLELKCLVEERLSVLQKTASNKDYNDLLDILK